MRSPILLAAALVFFLSGCIEPITFEEQGVNYLVVDGFISNEQKAHRIWLSRAAAYAGEDVSLVPNAEVYISDDLGNRTPLEPGNSGYYATPAQFAGVAGRSYTLHITTPEGEEYVSEPQTLQIQGSLDSVYYGLSTREYLRENNTISQQEGIEYFIDYTLPADSPTYLLWGWEATYLVKTPFPDPAGDIPTECYISENSSNFIKVVNSADLSSRQVVKDEFLFVVPDNKYWYTYSLNVKQYTISREVFGFFHAIEKQQENSGTIFDPTPARISGNIRNVNKPEEKVLGYFGVFGVKEERTFVDGKGLPRSPSEWVASESALYPECDIPEPTSPYCFDCRTRQRSTAERPEFWP